MLRWHVRSCQSLSGRDAIRIGAAKRHWQTVHLPLNAGDPLPSAKEVEHERDVGPGQRDGWCGGVVRDVADTWVCEGDEAFV